MWQHGVEGILAPLCDLLWVAAVSGPRQVPSRPEQSPSSWRRGWFLDCTARLAVFRRWVGSGWESAHHHSSNQHWNDFLEVSVIVGMRDTRLQDIVTSPPNYQKGGTKVVGNRYEGNANPLGKTDDIWQTQRGLLGVCCSMWHGEIV